MDVFYPPRWTRRDWMGVSHLIEKALGAQGECILPLSLIKTPVNDWTTPSLHSAAWKPSVMWLAWLQNFLGWQKPSFTQSLILLGWNTVNVHLLLLGMLWISFPWLWSDTQETQKGKPHPGHNVWEASDHRVILKLSSGSGGSLHQVSASEAKECTIWGLVIPL